MFDVAAYPVWFQYVDFFWSLSFDVLGVATVKMNRPPVNSLNLDFLTDFTITLEKLENEKSCRGLILGSVSSENFTTVIHFSNENFCNQNLRFIVYAIWFESIIKLATGSHFENWWLLFALHGNNLAIASHGPLGRFSQNAYGMLTLLCICAYFRLFPLSYYFTTIFAFNWGILSKPCTKSRLILSPS